MVFEKMTKFKTEAGKIPDQLRISNARKQRHIKGMIGTYQMDAKYSMK